MPPTSTGTFQPLRHRSGTMRERLHAYTKRTLGAGGSYNDAVALPPGESCAAWVAVHAVDFYNDVSTIWAVMSSDPYLNSFRPGEGFPSGVEYRWSDGPGEALSVSAPVYIEKVLGWIADQINDESRFPDDDDETEALRVFQTPQFAALCGQIFRRLFRVYGIIYSSFFGTLEALDMAPHLNSCFKHFMFFCTEFGLLPEREVEPLEVLVKPIRKKYYAAKQGGVTPGSRCERKRSMTGSFWEYRHEQEALGNSNGLKPFGTKAYYATLQGVGAGIAYGTFHWAYYPDKFAFSHKNTVSAGPSRGMEYLRHTMLRPAVAFSAVGVTYAGVESFLEEVKGSHHKDPWNSTFAGAAAGMVLGGFFTRRFDIASMTALGVGVVMGMVEVNGPNVVCDPVAQGIKKFPSSFSAKFEESEDLSDLKEKYPAYNNN